MKHYRKHLINFIALALACFIVLISGVAINWTSATMEEDLARSLETTLNASQRSLRALFLIQQAPTFMWANDERMISLTEALLKRPRTREELLQSPELRQLREYFAPVFGQFGFRGFFLIAPDDISIASFRDVNIGSINLLSREPNFLQRVREGGTYVSAPLRSDVPLEDYQGSLVEGLSTMFVASPVIGIDGSTIAVLATRIDPDVNYRAIFEQGRFGNSAETYAFNSQGTLISESRFTEDLIEAGLLRTDSQAALNIQVRDPGVDLTRGEIPQLPRNEQPLTRMALSASKQESGIDLEGYRDYRGVPVAGAWLWDEQLGFGIATEIDLSEAYRARGQIRIIVLGLTGFILLAVGLLRYVFYRTQKDIARSANIAILAKQEAETASVAKSDFLSSMSHELRSPLTGIMGFSELLEISEPKLSGDQRNFVSQIIKAGEHLKTLIDEVLDLSKIEAGKIDISLQDVNLQELLQDCLTLTTPFARGYNVTLENQTTTLPMVRADASRLRQAILNLISNGAKYNRSNGKVWVRNLSGAPGMLRLGVCDNGIGIREEDHHMMFSPFTRIAQDAKIEGTGIGLVISKRFMEAMGGDIGFVSTYGEGSTFWLEIPLCSEGAVIEGAVNEPFKPVSEQVSPTESSFLLLYIDDDPAAIQLMENVVKRVSGLRIISAPTAEIGLPLAEAHLPDLVILDINLPGIRGDEAARRLRSNPVIKDLHLIALSANAMESDIQRGLAAGFDEYLTKPTNIKNLIITLNQFVSERSDKNG